MKLRPIPLLITAALAITAAASLTARGQEDGKAVPPPPPAAPENTPRPPDPDRPPGPPPGRSGPRDERHEGHAEPRRDGPRGPEEGRRPEEGPRRDGERGFGSGSGRERAWGLPMPPLVPSPYLGVVTVPPPAVLNAQLGLKDGFGLVVGEVIPDSPAAKAGVQKHDVLTKFNDQQLVDAGQFSTLVRAAGKDSDATLTLLREAKEQKVSIKVGERMAPQRMPFPAGLDPREQMEKWKGPAQEGLKRMQDHMREYGEKMRDYEERLKDWRKNPTGDVPPPPAAPNFEAENAGAPINPVDLLAQAQPGGTRQIRLLQPRSATSYFTSDTKLILKDEKGEIEVSTKDGKRILVAKDAKGATIFDGPIETEAERKALPEEVRKKLETIQVRSAASATSSAVEIPVRGPIGGDGVQ